MSYIYTHYQSAYDRFNNNFVKGYTFNSDVYENCYFSRLFYTARGTFDYTLYRDPNKTDSNGSYIISETEAKSVTANLEWKEEIKNPTVDTKYVLAEVVEFDDYKVNIYLNYTKTDREYYFQGLGSGVKFFNLHEFVSETRLEEPILLSTENTWRSSTGWDSNSTEINRDHYMIVGEKINEIIERDIDKLF